MKILLVCAAGMSTGLVMKKMIAYWEEQGEELSITAVGVAEYSEVYKDYDIIMVGPQLSYRLKDIKADTGLPCDTIKSFDYATANCENIMKLAKKLYAEK